MLDTGYVFGGPFSAEGERLRLGEQLWDPGSTAGLSALGVGPGTRCLEVGAGRGSVAAWMAVRGADVTAVDLDVSRLDWLREHGVTVSTVDLDTDELPRAAFDLVHARLVVQHLPDRRAAVRRMCDALRPGGHLMLEDTDTTSLFSNAHGVFHESVKDAAYEAMCASGYHRRCGMLDVDLVLQAGLTGVRAQGRAEVVRGGSNEARWFVLWLRHLRPAMLAAGKVSEQDVDRAIADFGDPANTWLSQVMVTVTGRKEPGR